MANIILTYQVYILLSIYYYFIDKYGITNTLIFVCGQQYFELYFYQGLNCQYLKLPFFSQSIPPVALSLDIFQAF